MPSTNARLPPITYVILRIMHQALQRFARPMARLFGFIPRHAPLSHDTHQLYGWGRIMVTRKVLRPPMTQTTRMKRIRTISMTLGLKFPAKTLLPNLNKVQRSPSRPHQPIRYHRRHQVYIPARQGPLTHQVPRHRSRSLYLRQHLHHRLNRWLRN